MQVSEPTAAVDAVSPVAADPSGPPRARAATAQRTKTRVVGARPADGSGRIDRPWRRSLRAAGMVWLITHAGYAVLTFFVWFQSDRAVPRNLGSAYAKWTTWDAKWFVWIAEHGYTGYHGKAIDEERSAAFFPLYSLLIKIVSLGVLHPVIAAWLIAIPAQIGAFAILHRLTEQEFDRRSAGRTIWYMAVFPTGFYLAITYNASLFMLLMLGSIYLMRRGTWWGAAVVGAFATATRSSALLLFVPFCYEYLRQHEFRLRRVRWDAAWMGIMPVGIISYAIFCWVTFNDPLKFVHAQAMWDRERDWPWVGIGQTIRILFNSHNIIGNDVRNFMDLGAIVFVSIMLVLAFVGPWKVRRDQWFLPIFGVATILFVISFPSSDEINRVPLLSAARLSLEAFPAFMMVGRLGRSQVFDRAFTFVCLPLQGLWAMHYLLYHFIG